MTLAFSPPPIADLGMPNLYELGPATAEPSTVEVDDPWAPEIALLLAEMKHDQDLDVVADVEYAFCLLAIAKLLHDQYFRLLDFYFHILVQQRHLDLDPAFLPLTEQLAVAGQRLTVISDMILQQADFYFANWEKQLPHTEPVLDDDLDDLFRQTQSFDLDDLFHSPDPHVYPQNRNSPTTLDTTSETDTPLDEEDDSQAELTPDVLTIPEDEDPAAWMRDLKGFWDGFEAHQVAWPDLCKSVELPPGAIFLAVLLGGYPERLPGTDFYANEGLHINRYPPPPILDTEEPGED